MITDRIGRHEVLLPINHINYNFREKNSQVIVSEKPPWGVDNKICIVLYCKGKIRIKIPTKEMKNLPAVIRRQKTQKQARARTHARHYNFECDWLI